MYNGLEGDAAFTKPLDTQVITAVLRLGCSAAAEEEQAAAGAACMPADDIKHVMAASLNNGALLLGLDGTTPPPWPRTDQSHHPNTTQNRLRPPEPGAAGPAQALGARRRRAPHQRVRVDTSCCFTSHAHAKAYLPHPPASFHGYPRPFQDIPVTAAYDLIFTTHEKACTDTVTDWIKGALIVTPHSGFLPARPSLFFSRRIQTNQPQPQVRTPRRCSPSSRRPPRAPRTSRRSWRPWMWP